MKSLKLHLDFKFAQREEADREMKRYLARAIEGFFARYPEERVLSLLLTGGMTRGEGSCELVDSKSVVYSDYDLLVVLKKEEYAPEARRIFGKFAREVTDTLRGEEFCSHVDFGPVTLGNLERMRPCMFNVELAEHGKVVWGDSAVLSHVERPSAVQIPLDDALVLLFNRIVSQLIMGDSLRNPHGPDFKFAFYHNGKIFLDIVSCVLVLEHNYRPTYAERLSALIQSSDGLASRLRGLLEEAPFWTDYKLDPSTEKVCEKYSFEDTTTSSSVVALRIWHLLIPRMEETFHLCMEEAFEVKDTSLHSALGAYLRRKGIYQRLREYRSFLQSAGPAIRKCAIRRPPFFGRGAPLDGTYAAAATLFFSVDRLGGDSVVLKDKECIRQAARFLPMTITLPCGAEDSWEKLREKTAEVWRFLVKGGGY